MQKCKLQSLDVTKNLALTSLICNNNELTTLDVSNNTSLVKFYCNDNQLPKINVTANTALKEFDISNNLLSALNIRSNSALTYLCVSNNAELSMVDVKYNTALEKLYAEGLSIGEITLVANTALTEVNLMNNAHLKTIIVNSTWIFLLIKADNGVNVIDESGAAGYYPLAIGTYMPDWRGVIFYNDGKVIKLVSVEETTQTWYNANAWCADYGIGWYLPSGSEMEQIANQKTIINETLSACGFTTIGTGKYTEYWTSTEYNSGYAYSFYVDSYWSPSVQKTSTYLVRAVYTIDFNN